MNDPRSGESDADASAAAESQPDKDESAETIRVGSPFAVDPNPEFPGTPTASTTNTTATAVSPEVFYDVGPLRYTALGAVAAAVLVLLFAIPATWWFPSGGTLIAALGCVLSIFGMYSPIPKRSAAVLAVHVVIFLFCYGRIITQG
tara:strand:+ start:153894 stop:154331 length:438 start_codon:yes stop_codon:yes gene_type:complete